MVIKLPDGTTILEPGDPKFTSVEDLGANSPTNYILDPNPNKPVSQFILETYGIPFVPNAETGRVLGGSLPGYDIRNQDATTMMKLSLAVELRNPPVGGSDPAGLGEFCEVELDEFGIARFYIVGHNQANNLDIRYCVPTSQIKVPANLVIVRGYDAPPTRELRTSFDGLKNAEIMTYSECAAGSCDENAVGKFASISYDDPLLDQTYLDDIRNSYELKAFETLIGYVVDVKLPDGTDPDFAAVRGIKITFSDTTKEYIAVDAALMNNFITLGNTTPGSTIPTLLNSFTSEHLGSATGNVHYGNSNNKNATTLIIKAVNVLTGECSTEATSMIGSNITIPASRFTRLNKYGRPESDFIGVQEVVFSGRKIIDIQEFGGFSVQAFVRALKELISLQQGKNWTWTVLPSGDVEVDLYSVLEDQFSATIANLYANPPGPPTALIRSSTSSPNIAEATGPDAFKGFISNVGDRLGYMVVNNIMCVVVERKRPSIDIFDPNGHADDIAQQFLELTPGLPEDVVYVNGQKITGQRRVYGVRYTPIVVVDLPPPIAYAAAGPLQSIDAQTGQPGATILPSTGIIDQTVGIVDADPTTQQDFGETPLSILQDNTNGSTIDLTLPFCTDTECLEIAQNFFALQTAVVNTQSIVLGPDADPHLGDVLPDGSIINEINFSYSDSSQYLITVTAGPKYLTAGSFQDSKYQLRTEDVTREGVVIQDKGNGAEYLVRVQEFGELVCLSMVLDEITAGDRVQVRVYNVAQEKI